MPKNTTLVSGKESHFTPPYLIEVFVFPLGHRVILWAVVFITATPEIRQFLQALSNFIDTCLRNFTFLTKNYLKILKESILL
jgi:hypothetical protein